LFQGFLQYNPFLCTIADALEDDIMDNSVSKIRKHALNSPVSARRIAMT
jgi:hypothetical protein